MSSSDMLHIIKRRYKKEIKQETAKILLAEQEEERKK